MKIQHDFHIHTNLSLCAEKDVTVEYYVQKAEEIGLKKIGFANHFWDENIPSTDGFYVPQNLRHVEQIKTEIEKNKSQDVEIYYGCEVEYDYANHGVSLTEQVAECFDYVLVPNSHTHFTMPKEFYEPHHKHAEFMVQAYKEILNSNVSKYITAMAHPFEAVCCPYDYSILIDLISDDEFKYLFDATAQKDIAVEINIGNYHELDKKQIEQCSQLRMFRIAKDCGCKFIFGSDSHNRRRHGTYGNADIMAELLELEEKDIAEIAR